MTDNEKEIPGVLRFKFTTIEKAKEDLKKAGITGFKNLTEEDRKIGREIAKEMGWTVIDDEKK